MDAAEVAACTLCTVVRWGGGTRADGLGRQEGRKRNTKAGTDADTLDEQTR